MVCNGGLCIIIQLIIFLVSNMYNVTAKENVYIVLLKSPSLIHYTELMQSTTSKGQEPYMEISNEAMIYRSLLVQSHDNLLEEALGHDAVERKLYSYSYLINGFAASMSSQEATLLETLPEVVRIERDERMQKLTTYTPTYLDLQNFAWRYSSLRGVKGAGEGIVIGMVDTGIDPTHPSFANTTLNPYYNAKQILGRFKGQCEVGDEFPQSSCNGKIVAAQHFAKAAKVNGLFNANIDYDSPFDGDGHGTHTASIAAGNYGITVKVDGMFFGRASGMAPRARLAIYKALYPNFGGFYSDVVAALEKAVEDGVDILNLSIGPSTPPRGVATYFNMVDLALLAAVKAGVFVVQAAGNGGPSPFTVVSFSPWIFTVAAIQHDRSYSNSIILGNNLTITGIGLSPGTQGTRMHSLVLAKEAIRNYTVAKDQKLIEECQEAKNFEKEKVQGKILVCTYTYNFLIGRASMKNVEATAKELSASGVVVTISAWIQGFDLHEESMPFKTPVIIIPYANESKDFLNYYTETSQSYVEGASGRIVGVNARYSYETPRVASYSSRGPDPANSYYRASDVLKPNIAAPGSSIWGAWTPHGVDAQYFKGEKFAMISGTSMATPHIVGIAALVKQKNPKLSVAGIASAISTTSSIRDSKGRPLLLESSTGQLAPKSSKLATPFDMGSGMVNATAAIYPGLIFDAGYKDYVRFLCTVQGAEEKVKAVLGESCEKARASNKSKELATDLNAPYITVAKLQGRLKVIREVTQVGREEETYKVNIEAPKGVWVEVTPSTFTLESYKSQKLDITLTPSHDLHSHTPRFGSLLFTGNLGHFARIPISLISVDYTHPPSS